LFRIGNCTNKKIEHVPVPTSVLVPIPSPVVLVPIPSPVVLVPVPVRAPVPVVPAPVPVPVSAPTKAPTKAPIKVPTNAPVMLTTQSLLTSFITLSTRTIAANGPTPEDQALNYLIVNNTTFNFSQLLELNSMMTNVVQFRIRQRYALLTLWFQQAFTVTKWKTMTGWLVNANECDKWYHITCTSIDLGGTVGMQDVVTTVNLYDNNMIGTIPADLGLLTALTGFSVFTNELTGTLPVSIGEWTAMKYFAVYTNKLIRLESMVSMEIHTYLYICIHYYTKKIKNNSCFTFPYFHVCIWIDIPVS
jgi:hypothetical protein